MYNTKFLLLFHYIYDYWDVINQDLRFESLKIGFGSPRIAWSRSGCKLQKYALHLTARVDRPKTWLSRLTAQAVEGWLECIFANLNFWGGSFTARAVKRLLERTGLSQHNFCILFHLISFFSLVIFRYVFA
ncbi:hypothetical protein CsSME_00011565 [Camellia sinensis var. sinensis]